MCGWNRGGGKTACDFPSVQALPLQRAVWAWLYGLLSSPEVVMQQLERMRKKLAGEEPKSRRACMRSSDAGTKPAPP